MSDHSPHELVLQRVKAVLEAAGTDAGTNVSRGRPDAFGDSEITAINVRRSTGQTEAFGHSAERHYAEFEADLHVRGDDWETSSDRLHVQVDRALKNDAQLVTLCKGLRCIRTEARGEGGEVTRGRLTVTYQFQALSRLTDLGHLVS